jgi:dolichol-phosphate mannosyltransferase
MYDLTVIIPTLNEAETIRGTVVRIIRVLEDARINGQVLVVDDNSTDGTFEILKDLRTTYQNFNFIYRVFDHGLSQSLVDGFRIATADIIQVIDADGQHPAEKIPELYQAILDGNDIALCSRYISGGGIKNWAFHRRVMSWGATQLARIFFPTIADSGSGFFAFRKEVIKNAPLKPQGFRMLFEILGKGHWNKVKEIPYIFGIREKGESKLTYKTVISYLNQIWGLLIFSISHKDSAGYRELKRLVTFIAVGVSGVFVNIGTLYLLTEWLDFFYIWSAVMGVEISILSSFTLHELITFRNIAKKKHSLLTRVLAYHLITIVGSGISLSILIILTEFLGIWYIVSALIGILVAFFWNFTANRGATWSED